MYMYTHACIVYTYMYTHARTHARGGDKAHKKRWDNKAVQTEKLYELAVKLVLAEGLTAIGKESEAQS